MKGHPNMQLYTPNIVNKMFILTNSPSLDHAVLDLIHAEQTQRAHALTPKSLENTRNTVRDNQTPTENGNQTTPHTIRHSSEINKNTL